MKRMMFVAMITNNLGQRDFAGVRSLQNEAESHAKEQIDGKPGWSYEVRPIEVDIPLPRVVVATCAESDTEALYIDGYRTETHPVISAMDIVRLGGGPEFELVTRQAMLASPGDFPENEDDLVYS